MVEELKEAYDEREETLRSKIQQIQLDFEIERQEFAMEKESLARRVGLLEMRNDIEESVAQGKRKKKK